MTESHDSDKDHHATLIDTPRDLIQAFLTDRGFFDSLQDEERSVVNDLLQEILAHLEEQP